MVYTIYTDGSFDSKRKFGVYAVYILNNETKQKEILVIPVEKKKYSNSTQIEYLAIRRAIIFIINRKQKETIQKVQILSDCQSICYKLNKYKKIKCINKSINISDIKQFKNLKNNPNIKFKIKYIPRKQNLAHKYCYKTFKKIKQKNKISKYSIKRKRNYNE